MYFIQIGTEVDEYKEIFTDLQNPIFVSIFILIILAITIFSIVKYFLVPIKISHKTEKELLEQKNLKLLALFAEVSPDPLLRLDLEGYIIDANNAAKIIDSSNNIIGKNISDVLPIDIKSLHSNGTLSLLGREYSYYLKVIESENIILLFLRDITETVEYEKKLKHLSKSTQDEVELERQRIAFELHDGVGQNLLFAKVKLFNLMKKQHNKNSDEIKSLYTVLEKVINEIRRISYNLKPRVLDEMGFAPALISLCSDVSKETGINIQDDIQGKVTRLPKLIEASLYRVTQEAIVNVVKHSRATECIVQLKYENEIVKMTISDNGVGFDQDEINMKTKSSGLFHMRQRIEDLNGSITIDSVPGQGTILFIEINTRTLDEKA